MSKKTKEMLDESNFRFQKKYGQNFLINNKIPERISASVSQDQDLCILEIGAGAGALTVNLAKRYKKVVALEIDETLKPTLEQTLGPYENAKVIYSDVMQTDIFELCKNEFGVSKVAVCANLPYYITTPIIMRLFDSGVKFESITVMVQKEVAIRICSKPGNGDYGAFTAVVNFFADAKKLFDVGKGNFYPVPKIDSAILQLKPHYRYANKDNDKVLNTIKIAFSQRRKTLYNCIYNAIGEKISKDKIESIISECGFKSTVRAEELSIDDFINLSDKLYEK